ncbi:MAG TPA: SCP2 sterol-binding domain-containing protein [Candidatus Limnocylindria bacterium]|jgi:putative sterol carrier protein
MAYFKDREEVYQYIGAIFEQALSDPVLGPKFAESGVVLKLVYTDPDSTLVVDMPGGKVYRDQADLKPTVEMFMKADVAHRFWLGKVNIGMALAKGDMRAKGPVPKILKLVPLASSLYPRYRQMLVDDGRQDLAGA